MKKFMLFAVMCVSAACAGPDAEVFDDEVRVPIEGVPFQSASDAHISGQVGPVENISVSVQQPHVYDDGNYMAVELAAQVNNDHAIMLQLNTFDTKLVTPGTILANHDDPESAFTLLGCVGQAIDTYDMYDRAADQLIIDIVEIEDTNDLTIDVTATWLSDEVGEGNIVAFGSVTLHR